MVPGIRECSSSIALSIITEVCVSTHFQIIIVSGL